jgi:hypothetical protein
MASLRWVHVSNFRAPCRIATRKLRINHLEVLFRGQKSRNLRLSSWLSKQISPQIAAGDAHQLV